MKTFLQALGMVALILVGEATAAVDSFQQAIQPLLNEHCVTCHSTQEMKGDLDLERFASIDDVRKAAGVWESVLEQLENNEMPPKEAVPLLPERKSQLMNWVQSTLEEVALANAGDPGPVVLRRLSNAEYAYTIRDLTGVSSLDPTKEFPVDGAAGEGFTNASAGLVMSPSLLTKYLDAAKDIADHAVLLPDGIRFSPSTSARDWSDETLAMIREFYSHFTESSGATAVNLQGIQFDTNAGGRLPLQRYMAALLAERAALQAGKSLEEVSASHGLNTKYLTTLWNALNDTRASLILDSIRQAFQSAASDESEQVTQLIRDWQNSLWRFSSVGHIGKVNSPQSWQEPVSPLLAQQEMRLKLSPPADGSDLKLYLAALDAGDGSEYDYAVWENARIVAAGRPDLPLKDVGAMMHQLAGRREAVIAKLVHCLAAAHEVQFASQRKEISELAREHNVAPELLVAWLDYLGIGSSTQVKLEPLLVDRLESTPDYDFIKGWTGQQALSLLANSSDSNVRIPGTMKPHSVAMHPSPQLASVVAWRSPIMGSVTIEGFVQDAHPECGNGVSWSVDVRRGNTCEVVASGVSRGAQQIDFDRIENIQVHPGDVIALAIGPREGSHVCDLTAIDLCLDAGALQWNLAQDVSPDVLQGNPHRDSHGNPNVWYFFSEPAERDASLTIPPGSFLSQWRNSMEATERSHIAERLQQFLRQEPQANPTDSPDRRLYDQLLSLKSSLLLATLHATSTENSAGSPSDYGLDPNRFGTHPDGSPIDANSLCVQAPMALEVSLPSELVEDAELVVTGRLHPCSGGEGSVQMQILTSKPSKRFGIAASKTQTAVVAGQWSDNNLRTNFSTPVIVNDGGPARRRIETAFDDFRNLFPIALCYPSIVPVDEVVTLTLFYREDDQLQRLMLDEVQTKRLDQLWEQLRFVSQSPLKQVDGFEQLYQFATQDASPSAFEPMREPIMHDAQVFKQQLLDSEPLHIQAVLDFARRAWRRPLTDLEQNDLRSMVENLRSQGLPHPATVHALLARVLVSPAFLYRSEKANPGDGPAPLNDWELATRLSYFLWSSTPDEELRGLAAAGKLRDPNVLSAQAVRMLKDAKVRRLAMEFGCQWLQVRDLETLDEKSERHFPTFLALRGDMQEECVRFLMDMFQEDRSLLSLIDSDHSFVNGALAEHYALDVQGDEWRKVDGMRASGRGGMLAFASTLAKQSGASRTSPILRGNWLSEVVLGEKLPRPPKGVPVLPEEAPSGLTERQLTELHSSDPSCARCHQRIDPFGFALEGFDAIGRARSVDTSGLKIDTRTQLPNGDRLEGLEGLKSYLLTQRRDDFLRQFCRKMLGYALGRSVQLSDKPLIDSMLIQLNSHEHRVHLAVESIVRSPQFRELRGLDFQTQN